VGGVGGFVVSRLVYHHVIALAAIGTNVSAGILPSTKPHTSVPANKTVMIGLTIDQDSLLSTLIMPPDKQGGACHPEADEKVPNIPTRLIFNRFGFCDLVNNEAHKPKYPQGNFG